MNLSCPPAVADRFAFRRPKEHAQGFTLVELLVSMAVFAMIMVVIFGLTQQAGNAWRSTSSKIEAFQGARAAFETITDTLSQATLNTYYDYADASGRSRNSLIASSGTAANFVPATYTRFSDLHFISGKALLPTQVTHSIFFQTPAGYSASSSFQQMDTLLNACGFYVAFDKDPSRPAFLTTPERYRFRLFEFIQPSEQFSVFSSASGNSWFTVPAASSSPPRAQMADNIIALIVLPKASDADSAGTLAPLYEYDSRDTTKPVSSNQLPPLVEVVLVAIDEPSAKRLELKNGSTPPDFGLASLFQQPASLDDDLKALEKTLIGKHLNYRIFRTTVPLRSSKWSSST